MYKKDAFSTVKSPSPDFNQYNLYQYTCIYSRHDRRPGRICK